MLQVKIKEQEARSRQLEQELEEMARKHADAEAEWRTRMTSVKSETADVETRNERLDKRDDQGKRRASRYDKERMDRRDDQAEKLYDGKEGRRKRAPSDEYSHLEEGRYQTRSRGSDLNHDEIEGKSRRSRRHVSYTDADTEESWRDGRGESSRREGRGSRKSRHVDAEGHMTEEGPSGGRTKHEKSDRKARKSREKSVESENIVTKTHAEVTEVQVVRDDEVYRLSKGRIELLESEKSALMELNTSLQEENKAVKQLALSLQKGTGKIFSVLL